MIKHRIGFMTVFNAGPFPDEIQAAQGEAKVVDSDRAVCGASDFYLRLVPARGRRSDMMGQEMGDPIEILLVEDNAGDVRLTREALEEAKVPNRLHVAPDGMAALQFLNKQKPFAGVPEPDLVLLDLNIPKRSGFEVLDQIKSDPHLRHIPVIVLTSSNADGDVLRSYQSYANSYVIKPVDLDQYFKVVEIIDEFWLSTVRLPGRRN